MQKIIDARGDQCPLPVLKLKKALNEAQIGDLLIVEANDSLAAIDIPNFCRAQGHQFVDASEVKTFTRYKIIKGDKQAE